MKNRRILTTGMLVIIASMFGFGAAIAEDEIQASDDTANSCLPGITCCRRPDWVCANYPPLYGLSCEIVTGGCESTFPFEGEDCLQPSRGEEIRVIALSETDEDSKRPIDWLIKHDKDSVLMGIGPLACLINTVAPKISFLELPDAGHCATMVIDSSNQTYLEFFGDVPWCLGWVECKCE